MYNETIYNVAISPHIENKILRKRSFFITWIWTSIVFMLYTIGYATYEIITNNNQFMCANTVFLLISAFYILGGIYFIFYNPLRKYHISLQIYLYLFFMDYYYFQNAKYPDGFSKIMRYVFVIQACIDSIDKYIKMLESLLISGDKTIAHITYLRALRDLLYKMKGEAFFKNQITSFRYILDHYYNCYTYWIKGYP